MTPTSTIHLLHRSFRMKSTSGAQGSQTLWDSREMAGIYFLSYAGGQRRLGISISIALASSQWRLHQAREDNNPSSAITLRSPGKYTILLKVKQGKP